MAGIEAASQSLWFQGFMLTEAIAQPFGVDVESQSLWFQGFMLTR